MTTTDQGESGRERRTHRLRSVVVDLTRELKSLDSELISTRAIRANGGDDDEHDPDGIPLSSVLQLLGGQKARVLAEIRGAELALTDLEVDRYGICRICAKPIPDARLEVRPTATTCVDCAARTR